MIASCPLTAYNNVFDFMSIELWLIELLKPKSIDQKLTLGNRTIEQQYPILSLNKIKYTDWFMHYTL